MRYGQVFATYIRFVPHVSHKHGLIQAQGTPSDRYFSACLCKWGGGGTMWGARSFLSASRTLPRGRGDGGCLLLMPPPPKGGWGWAKSGLLVLRGRAVFPLLEQPWWGPISGFVICRVVTPGAECTFYSYLHCKTETKLTTHTLTLPASQPPTHSLTHSPAHLPTHSHPLSHRLTHSPTHLPTHSHPLSHRLTHSPTHLPTHSHPLSHRLTQSSW